MRVRHASALPRCWRRIAPHDILTEYDLHVTSGPLRAKLLIFKNRSGLRNFWKKIGKGDLGSKCTGAVNALAYEVHHFSKSGESAYIKADPRYFCVIGLVKGHLNMEVISHESMHAGFAYAKRRTGKFWVSATEMDEEKVCYPAGRIARQINMVLYKEGLYE